MVHDAKENGPNLPKLEEETLAFWDKNKIFERSLEKTKDSKPFTFYDGPPFAFNDKRRRAAVPDDEGAFCASAVGLGLPRLADRGDR